MTESEFQSSVAHFRPARTDRGWRTPVAADGAGWPDLTLARPGELIFAELKADKGRLSLYQGAWLALLAQTGAEVHVWRPSDWPEIEARLTRARRQVAA